MMEEMLDRVISILQGCSNTKAVLDISGTPKLFQSYKVVLTRFLS
jgi:hypothetical protein